MVIASKTLPNGWTCIARVLNGAIRFMAFKGEDEVHQKLDIDLLERKQWFPAWNTFVFHINQKE